MTVHLEFMPDERLAAWIERGHLGYIDARIKSGESREMAVEKAEQSLAETFPNGRPLDTHLIFEIRSDDTVVGHLWLGPFPVGSTEWWVYELQIDEAHRRHGYARRALELAHAAAKERGATAIGLNVFGYNTGAKELYDSLGYAVTATQMKRPL